MRLLPAHMEIDSMWQAFVIEQGLISEDDYCECGDFDIPALSNPETLTEFQREMVQHFTRIYTALYKMEGLLNEQG